MSIQLPLGIGLRDDASFDNFISGTNAEAVSAVQRSARNGGGDPIIYLCGGDGVGKTHLLQAACHQASAQGEAAAYIPLAQAGELSPAMLEGLEQLALVCIDDIQTIAAQPAWEAALFHLYNRLRDSGTRCIIAGNAVPAGLALRLPDLVSRLAWGLVLHLAALDDEGLLAALQLRARNRGLDMPEEVAQFLLRRHSRDMPALFDLLDHLDHASLAAQRRLTIPFVKDVVG